MTSFKVRADTESALRSRMDSLGIREQDLVEQFVRGSGSGGQKRNKTSSCVVLRHVPSGIEVRCQKERSQAMNRFFARRELCDRMEKHLRGEVHAKDAATSKVRRQKARRARKTKVKLLELKVRRKSVKTARQKPSAHD
jgi:protein subunit release factor B